MLSFPVKIEYQKCANPLLLFWNEPLCRYMYIDIQSRYGINGDDYQGTRVALDGLN